MQDQNENGGWTPPSDAVEVTEQQSSWTPPSDAIVEETPEKKNLIGTSSQDGSQDLPDFQESPSSVKPTQETPLEGLGGQPSNVPQTITNPLEAAKTVPQEELDVFDTDKMVRIGEIEAELYKVNGKPIDSQRFKDLLFDPKFLEDAQAGKINVEINGNSEFIDPEILSIAERNLQSGTQLGDKWESLKSGAYSAASGVAGLKNLYYNTVEEITGVPVTQSGWGAIEAAASKKASEDFAKDAEAEQQKIRQYKEGFVDSFKSGNYADMFQQGGNAVTNSIPYSAAAGTLTAIGGAPLAFAVLAPIGSSREFASMNISEDEKIQGLSRAERLARGYVVGSLESAADIVAGRAITRSFDLTKSMWRGVIKDAAVELGEEGAKKVAEETAKNIYGGYLKNIGLQGVEEYLAEGGTEGLTMLYDDLTGLREYNAADYLRNINEAGFLGAFSGAATTGGLGAIPVGSYSALKASNALKSRYDNMLRNNPEAVKSQAETIERRGLVNGEEAKALNDNIETREKAVKAVPADKVSDTETVDLVQEKQQLKEEAKDLDDAFKAPIEEKIAEIDSKLQDSKEYDPPKVVTSPTEEKYATVNRNDEEGTVTLTKSEYEAETGQKVELPKTETPKAETPAKKTEKPKDYEPPLVFNAPTDERYAISTIDGEPKMISKAEYDAEIASEKPVAEKPKKEITPSGPIGDQKQQTQAQKESKKAKSELKSESDQTEPVTFIESLNGTPVKDLSEDVAEGVSQTNIDGADVLMSEVDENTVKLESIKVPEKKRGQGLAKSAIEKITDEADKQEKTIVLNVVPEGEATTEEGLRKLYEQAGFVPDGKNSMRREPLREGEISESQKAEIAESIGKSRKVKPKNIKGLIDVMGGIFGLKPKQAESAAVVGDVIVENMAKRAGASKDEMYQRIAFAKAQMKDLPQGVKFQVDAWHGSPYQFDEFTTEKIGTGEGAQAFGWGLYFTDLESIAKHYAESVGSIKANTLPSVIWSNSATYFKINGIDIKNPIIQRIAENIYKAKNVRGNSYTIDNAKSNLDSLLKTGGLFGFNLGENITQKQYDGAITFLKNYTEGGSPSIELIIENIPKYLYKVSLHKGKSPDLYTWLEWDKPVTDTQRKKVSDYIMSSVKMDGYITRQFLNAGFEFDWSNDGRNPTKVYVPQKITGKELYNAFIRANYDLTDNPPKKASMDLLEAGIDGIKYPAESISRGATSDTARGFNYVVFDENAVSIEEVIKFQKDAEKARGAMMMAMDNQAIIYALTDPNVSTPLHELAHVYEHYLTDAERKQIKKWSGYKSGTVEFSEAFARGFEKFLAEGKVSNPRLQKIFENFKQWLTDIYNGIKGSDIDIELNDKMRDIYNEMLADEKVETPKTETNAQEQQSGEMRKQGEQETSQGKSDSDLPKIDKTELQDGKETEGEKVTTQEEIYKIESQIEKLREQREAFLDDFEIEKAKEADDKIIELTKKLPQEETQQEFTEEEKAKAVEEKEAELRQEFKEGHAFKAIEETFSPISVAEYEAVHGKGMYEENKGLLKGLVTKEGSKDAIDNRSVETDEGGVEYFDPADIMDYIDAVAFDRATTGETKYEVPKDRKPRKKAAPKKKVGEKVNTADFLRNLAEDVRKGKIDKDILMSGLPGFKQAFNTAIETVAKTLEASAYVSDIVDAVIAEIKKNKVFMSSIKPAMRKALDFEAMVAKEMGMSKEDYLKEKIAAVKGKAEEAVKEAEKKAKKEGRAEGRRKVITGKFNPETSKSQTPKEKSSRPATEEVKKTVQTKRAYEGQIREEVKDFLEENGLTRMRVSLEEQSRLAEEFISKYGEDTAIEAVRNGDVRGGQASSILAQVIKSIDDKMSGLSALDVDELSDLSKKQSEAIVLLGDLAYQGGAFNAQLAFEYENSDIGYNVERKISEYKEAFGEISEDVEKKFREWDTERKELKKKLAQAIKDAEKAEEKAAIEAIQGSVSRSNKATYKRRAKSVANEFRKLKTKPLKFTDSNGNEIVITEQAVVSWNNLIEIGAKAIEQTGIIADGVKAIKDKLSEAEWFSNLSNKDKKAVLQQIEDHFNPQLSEETTDGPIKISKSFLRELVEGGIDNIEDLVSAVKEEISDEFPNATDREIRDAITQYGRTISIDKDGINKELRRLKEIGRVISQLEDVSNKVRPARSGVQRERFTDEQEAEIRALKKQLREAMKDLPVDQESESRQLASLLDVAKRRIENQIDDLQREIDNNERVDRKGRKPIQDARLKELIKQRDELKLIHEETFKNDAKATQQKLNIALRSVERSIAEYEDRIKEGRLDGKAKKESLTSSEIAAAKERLSNLKGLFRQMQVDAGVVEKKRLEMAKARVKARTEEYRRRLNEKDFSKKKPTPLKEDEELLSLKAELLRVNEKFDKEFHKKELENRTKWQRRKDAAWDAWGLTRVLMATGEASFVMIQGGIMTTAHPRNAMEAFRNALRFMSSEKRTEEWLQKVKSEDYYPALKKSKLALTEPHAKLSAREELYYSDWADVVWRTISFPFKFISDNARQRFIDANPIKAIERAAIGYLDTHRLLRYLDGVEVLESQGKTFESNPQDYKDVADAINTMTGRASLGSAELFAETLSKLFFSPRNWASQFKTATPYALYHFGKMTPTARKMAISDMSKFVGITTGFVMMAAAYLNGDDDEETGVEFDPRSSDFMKIKIGNRRIDPWGGRIQQIVLSSRIIMEMLHDFGPKGLSEGGVKKSSGEILPLGIPFKTPSMGEIGVQMAVNKLSPSAHLIVNYMQTKEDKDGNMITAYGEDYSPVDDLTSSLKPIFWETVNELLIEDPSALNGILTAAAFFGENVNVYDSSKKGGKGPVAQKLNKEQSELKDEMDSYKESVKKDFSKKIGNRYTMAMEHLLIPNSIADEYKKKFGDRYKDAEGKEIPKLNKKSIVKEHNFDVFREKEPEIAKHVITTGGDGKSLKSPIEAAASMSDAGMESLTKAQEKELNKFLGKVGSSEYLPKLKVQLKKVSKK